MQLYDRSAANLAILLRPLFDRYRSDTYRNQAARSAIQTLLGVWLFNDLLTR